MILEASMYILQNLGKVDRTADEILDDHITNFSKQQYAATRLQKELNNYIRCIRACSTSSRALLEAVNEVYEPEWGGKELLTVNSQSVELLWNDFAHRLAEQVLIPLNTYQGQFPETRKKIEKRGRKLVDFDGERHALQAMQSNPRRGEAKLTRQRESLEAAKRTYEVLNSELHEELPALFNSRIVFLVSAMSTLFASEHIFHSESSKVFTELEGIVEKLAKESGKGTLNFQVPSNAVLNNTSDSPKDGESLSDSLDTTDLKNRAVETQPEQDSLTSTEQNMDKKASIAADETEKNNLKEIEREDEKSAEINNNDEVESNKNLKINKDVENDVASIESKPLHGILSTSKHKMGNGRSSESPINDRHEHSPSSDEPGVLYRVRATYRYQKEDVDELSFEAGEIVRVIEYDDPEEQEEGWLMGIKDNGERGMFPANFTRPI
ncbi:Amphiphysin [Orchesella cincta]|uniref:Amphiphysin n=1 Tax=Orchesella cincta TaxID=48709 RepID=A0A1D2MTV9_ORCCI|nr:Amphiphysin [Orchesella cincta]